MKKKFLFTLLMFVSCALTLFSVQKELSFKDGERLGYKINYGIVSAGEVSFETQKIPLDGDTVFYTSMLARTTGVLDKLYNMRDTYESYYDRNTFLPYYSVANVKEGKHQFYDEISFSQQNLQVTSKRKQSTYNLERESFDVVSGLNYFRSLNWDSYVKDQIIEIPIYHEGKFFPLQLCYRGKENLSFGGNKYKCHLFVPFSLEGKIFRNKKEAMSIWFSADKNKIPVFIRVNLAVGSFRLSLHDYQNLVNPFEAKLK